MSSDSKLIITSVHHPSVVRFSKLKDEKYRNSEGLFLCEGVKLVKEALNAGFTTLILKAAEETGAPEKPPFSAVAVMVASPEEIPVTRPLPLTVKILSLELAQEMVLS